MRTAGCWSRPTRTGRRLACATYTEVPEPKLGNPHSGQLLMSNSISGFWLHLDQPQRFRLQRIGVGYLEERRLSGIAGHHAAITTACTQVSHQCSKALHRQNLTSVIDADFSSP